MTDRPVIRLDATTRAAVASGRLAHVVTLNPDGSPQVSCVFVGWDGDELLAGHLLDHKKLKNVRRDDRVSISIESDVEFPGFSPYLVLEGTATVEDGGAVDVLRRITTEQFGADNSYPPPGEWPAGYVLRIRPHNVYGVGPWAVVSD
ncbi:MAG: hypothetical protein QOJ66_3119 [Ilumatobacteraceae bacterium]